MDKQRSIILDEVTRERIAQDAMWGEQNHDFPHYYQILNEELGEVSQDYLDSGYARAKWLAGMSEFSQQFSQLRLNMRKEMIQCAAVMVAMIECGDRNEWWPSK